MTYERGEAVRDVMIVLLAAVLIILFASCGRGRIPTVTHTDSARSVVVVRDTAFIFSSDSALARYYIECIQTAEGYQAQIKQLMEQRPGQYINTPTATTSGQTLTVTAYLPGRTVYVPVYRYYSTSVKAGVYVKYTNILLWWQKWLMYAGCIFLFYLCYAVFRRVRSHV